jgi:hypothetical protein
LALVLGTRLGPHEVVSLVGEDRIARFRREAQVLAEAPPRCLPRRIGVTTAFSCDELKSAQAH